MSDNKSYRIRTSVLEDSDKYLRMKLDQDFDQLDVLSLSISQEQAYESFCSDYGAVVGRVVANRAFGVPNVRVSIFVPLQDEDRDDEEIRDLYPFETPTDKDENGVRYNLLPKKRQYDCHSPLGTMPSKREILDNDTMIEVFDKYYRYSTVTNASGDFMLFGVPVGYHTIHMDADLSDIGSLSRKPYHFIAEGSDPNQFASPTKFRETDNMDNAIQIESRNKGVFVRPFWGDTDNCEVGISRLDFTLSQEFKSYALFTGSIFGDSQKYSVNKNCRPRRKMGEICAQNTAEGTIEMIRKTRDGSIEDFTVNGGRVIDENGAWSYLVPLNLENVVTDEFGNQVPSEDPSIGLPTRASVRFKISMDVTGDEGRVRKRAKYLVPHNPDRYAESDFTFGQSTNDRHFKDIYWNKIYTVSNHIPRFQGNRGVIAVNNRNFVGLKNIDECPGSANPFPYNKVNPQFNPLITIICILASILFFLIFLLNSTVIFLVNLLIAAVNAVFDFIDRLIELINNTICDLSITIPKPVNKDIQITNCKIEPIGDSGPDPVPCISIKCLGDDYAPGCVVGEAGFSAVGGGKDVKTDITELYDCLGTQLATTLETYELDFYNDWVNGSLYAFLFKHKSKSDGSEKYCAYDCETFDSDNSNNCSNNLILETCFSEPGGKGNEDTITNTSRVQFEDGAVYFNEKEREFFYPPTTHSPYNFYKLFATDIVHLGSFLECDPDGVPFIFDEIGVTTYQTPPLVTTDNVTGVEPLLFDLSCFGGGVLTDHPQCVNQKRVCELNVGLDERDTVNGVTPDGYVGKRDMEDNILPRDVITFYNLPSAPPERDVEPFDSSVNTDLANRVPGTSNRYYEEFGENDGDYVFYRDANFLIASTEKMPQFNNSYFFYFGLVPGNTAFDKTITKFFGSCDPKDQDALVLSGDVTNVSSFGASDGAIDITVLNGEPDFRYEWSSPNGYNSTITNETRFNGDISGLEPGLYTVKVVDGEGSKGTATFEVKGPPPLTCFDNVINATTSESSDGQIEVIMDGGNPDYTVVVTNEDTGSGVCNDTVTGNSFVCSGLSAASYSYKVTDSTQSSNGGPLTCSGETEITAPPKLEVEISKRDVTCFEDNDGRININVVSGTALYNTTAYTSGSFFKTNGLSYNNLSGGTPGDRTYTVRVEDSTGQIYTEDVDIYDPPELTLSIDSVKHVTCFGKDDGRIEYSASGGRPNYDVTLDSSGSNRNANHGSGSGFKFIGLEPALDYSLEIEDISGCTASENNIAIQEPDELVIDNIEVFSDHNIVVTAGGGNPSAGFVSSSYFFRVSRCDCSGTTMSCSPVTDSSFDNYVTGTNINGDKFDFFSVDQAKINDNTDGIDYTEVCPDDVSNSGYSEVIKIEVTDSEVYNEYGSNVDCGSNPDCLKTVHIAVTNDDNGNATGYVDASGWDSNFDDC